MYRPSPQPYESEYGRQHSPKDSKATLYQNDKGADTDVSLDQQYLEDAEKRGITASKQTTRGSVAAQMAAAGEIPRKAGLRMWRSEEHQGTFSRGGRGRMCGRCCCCTLLVVILVILGVVAAFLLWVRAPNVQFNGVDAPESGNLVEQQSDGFMLNFELNIGVQNPNFFGAHFNEITAKAYYPGAANNKPIGGGNLTDVDIKAHTNNFVHFPFSIDYHTADDPGEVILKDIADRCGFTGNAARQLKVNYSLTLKLKVLIVTISPTFSSDTSFDCPLSEGDISSFLGDSIGSLIGGGTRFARTKRWKLESLQFGY